MDISVSDILRAWPQILAGLTEGQKLRFSKEAERMFAQSSTYYLAKFVLGYDKLDNDFHVAACQAYDDNFYINQFHLHPRKHFKTTMFTVAGNIRRSLVDPDISIAIITNSLDVNGREFIEEIKGHFQKGEKFRALFPEHATQRARDLGTSLKFTTPARTNPAVRMPTFSAFSGDREITGCHFTGPLHFDDIVDRKNTATEDLMAKVHHAYRTSLATAPPNRNGIPWHNCVGTRWHYYDPWARIMEKEGFTKNFYFLRTAAEWNEEDEDGNTVHKRLCPEIYSQEWLDYYREDLGEYMYSCLFLNEPVPEGAMAMNPDWLRYYSPHAVDKIPRRKVITVDPANSIKNTQGDPTVIGVYDMDPDANIRVLEIRRGWWTIDEIIQQICDAHKLHNVLDIGVEAVNFQEWLCFKLEQYMRENGYHFRLHPIRRRGQGIHKQKKDEGGRQERVIPFLRDGKIWVRQDEPELEALKKELRQYPVGRHDDILDTLTDAIELLRPPDRRTRELLGYRKPPITLRGHGNFQTGYSSSAVQEQCRIGSS